MPNVFAPGNSADTVESRLQGNGPSQRTVGLRPARGLSVSCPFFAPGRFWTISGPVAAPGVAGSRGCHGQWKEAKPSSVGLPLTGCSTTSAAMPTASVSQTNRHSPRSALIPEWRVRAPVHLFSSDSEPSDTHHRPGRERPLPHAGAASCGDRRLRGHTWQGKRVASRAAVWAICRPDRTHPTRAS